MGRPTMKATACLQGAASRAIPKAEARMPLTPAMRPDRSSSAVAAPPIRRPPAIPSHGDNGSIDSHLVHRTMYMRRTRPMPTWRARNAHGTHEAARCRTLRPLALCEGERPQQADDRPARCPHGAARRLFRKDFVACTGRGAERSSTMNYFRNFSRRQQSARNAPGVSFAPSCPVPAL